MTLLTKDLKAIVLKKAVEFGMSKDVAKLQAAKAKLADAFYETTFGAESARMVKQLGSENWLSYGNDVGLTAAKGEMFQSRNYIEKFERMTNTLKLSKDRPIPVKGLLIEVNPGEPFYEQGLALFQLHQTNWKKREMLEEKIRALLATVNTYEQFKSAWPDGARFLPPEPVKVRALVTTNHVAELNAVIGLPPEDEAV